MSAHNPLGPTRKHEPDPEAPCQDPRSLNAKRVVRPDEAPTQNRLKTRWTLILCLLISITAALFFLRSDKESVAPGGTADDTVDGTVKGTVKGTLPSSVDKSRKQHLSVDLSGLSALLTDTPTVCLVPRVPREIENLMSRQWVLFNAVALTDYSRKTSIWEQALEGFPESLYFSRPRLGKVQTGGPELRERHGNSNVFPMSLSLYGSFQDAIRGIGPDEYAGRRAQLQEEIDRARAERGPGSPGYDTKDAINQGRDQADLAWLNALHSFLRQLDSRHRQLSKGNETFASRGQALEAWTAFQETSQGTISDWVDSHAYAHYALDGPQSLEIPWGSYPVVVLQVGTQSFYFSQRQLPDRINISR